MYFRIMAKEQGRILGEDEKRSISSLLKTEHDGGKKRHWSLTADESHESDIDLQINSIFSQLTADAEAWHQLGESYKMDVFTGLFLERTNGGVELSCDSMRLLSQRGIDIGFDIYFELPDS